MQGSSPLKYVFTFSPILIFIGFTCQGMPLQFSMLLGAMVFPYILQIGKLQKSIRYFWGILLVGGILLFFRSYSLYYFMTVFVLLFVLDNYWGGINNLPVLLAIVVSPVLGNIIYTWSFPIRLKLSLWAGNLLELVGMNIQVNGNLLILDGNSFSVDPACIGLKMLVTSLVLGIVILAYFEKKYKVKLSLWRVGTYLLVVLVGAICANFIRLLTLIVFHILPENPLHDIVGLLSLVIYTLLPFYFLMAWVFKQNATHNSQVYTNADNKYNTSLQTATNAQTDIKTKIGRSLQLRYPILSNQINKCYGLVYGFTMLFLVYNGIQFLKEPVENIASIENIELQGFKKSITPNGVLKLQNQESLVYIKPPVRFFQGSHDPRFCWQGSGYTFSEVMIKTIGSKEVYTAILTNDTDKLYTAWWYQNQNITCVHDWEWRWQTLRGQGDYYMINVNCENQKSLENEVNQFSFIKNKSK